MSPHAGAEWHHDNPECHFGDHYYEANGHCRDCDTFNGAWLNWMRVERAEREGRHHGDHYHLTSEKAAACPRPNHDEGPCASAGGCMAHDATDEYVAAIYAAEELDPGSPWNAGGAS